jgi:hypothetical protein
MIVNNFHIVGFAVQKSEAKPPLIVDSDAVLSRAVAAQFFQPVTGRRAQEVQACGRIQLRQLALGSASECLPMAGAHSCEQSFSVFASE